MVRHFYSHIIELDSIYIELETLSLKPDEKRHLIDLVESSTHLAVMDTLLTELPEEHRKMFLHHVREMKHEEIWKILHKHVSDVHKKILKAAGEVKKELLEDIREIKAERIH